MKLVIYLKEVLLPIASVVIVAPIFPYFVGISLNDNLASFFVVTTTSVVSTAVTILSLGCSTSEREYILYVLKKKIFRKK